MNIFNPRTNQIYSENFHDKDERYFFLDFPVYSYTVAVVSFITGLSFDTARIVNIVALASLTVILFSYLKRFSTVASVMGVLLLNLHPLVQFSAVSVQPDLFMVFFLFLFIVLSDSGTFSAILIRISALTLSTLIKPYSYIIVLPLMVRNFNQSKRVSGFLTLIIPAFSSVLWFIRSVPTESGSYWHLRQRWILTIPNSWELPVLPALIATSGRFIFDLMSLPVFFFSLIGLYKGRKTNIGKTLILLYAGNILAFLVAIPGYSKHDYYFLPLIVISCLTAGIGMLYVLLLLVRLFKIKTLRTKTIFMVILIAPLTAYGIITPFSRLYRGVFTQHAIYEPFERAFTLDNLITESDSVLVYHDEESPVLLGVLDRKGWLRPYTMKDCTLVTSDIQRLNPDKVIIFPWVHYHAPDKIYRDPRSLTDCLSEEIDAELIFQRNSLYIYSLR